ncbi:Psp operon transcriptional activator [hydrothermal vent metagenome]|uniref:Psp operon transcriptional activator n=1 Tax=hydrothermal vent metagenome TaxID=652676 RepID=A0A3B0SRK3_9ZZZZ
MVKTTMSVSRELPPLIGQSQEFLQTLDDVSRAASLDRPLLLIGERGTGKELLAARAHFLSPRWSAAYVAVNCAALSENLLESELFGHEAGAFTGATKQTAGRFERADGGTLFLDEIANASLRVQEKILRVVEYGEFERVGGTEAIHCDVRVLAATHVDLPQQVQRGTFRADLLDRLAFDVVTLPPLRARWEDIPILAQHFATQMVRELGLQSFDGFSMQAMRVLMKHHWPGNVRELKNVVERNVHHAAAESGNPDVVVEQIKLDPFASAWRPVQPDATTTQPTTQTPPAIALPEPEPGRSFSGQVRRFERVLLRQALHRNQHHLGRTAKDLGLSYDQMRHYAGKHNLLQKPAKSE